MSAVFVPNVTLPKVSASPSFACFAVAVVSVATTLYSIVMPFGGRLACVNRPMTLRRSWISFRSSAIHVTLSPVSAVVIRSRVAFMNSRACSSPAARALR